MQDEEPKPDTDDTAGDPPGSGGGGVAPTEGDPPGSGGGGIAPTEGDPPGSGGGGGGEVTP